MQRTYVTTTKKVKNVILRLGQQLKVHDAT